MRAVRWGGVILGVPLLAGLGMWAVGSTLPVAHRASVTRVIEADPATVWSRIDDVAGWADWRDTEVEILGPDSVRIRMEGETLDYRVERPSLRTLVTRIVTPGLPFGGRWTWSARPVDDGATEVTIVEEGEVYDPIFRFFSRFVFGQESSIRAALDDLEASFS